MKLTIAIVLLLLGTAIADYPQTKFYKSGFDQVPQVVINTNSSDDSLFAGALANTLFYTPGESSDLLYAWKINWDMATNTSKSIIKRAIDASTLKAKGDDQTLDIKIKSKVGLMGQAGLGYIGFPILRDDGDGTAINLFYDILPVSATSDTKPVEVKLTDNSDKNTGFFINNAWFLDGHYYVLFNQFDMKTGNEKALFIQAIKGDGTTMFDKAVKIASFKNNVHGSTVPIAGPDSNKDPSKIYVVYKDMDAKATYQTTVAVSNGNVDEPTKLVADSDTSMYFPDAVVSASSVFAVILDHQQAQDQSYSEELKVYYNGATSKPKVLGLTIPDNYYNPVLQTFNHKDGFIALAEFAGESDAIIAIKVFNSDGSEQIAQKTIANTQGNMVFFQDADGALWTSYNDFDMSTGKVGNSYLGKVLA